MRVVLNAFPLSFTCDLVNCYPGGGVYSREFWIGVCRLRWLPIVYCPRALISKISRWRKRSNSTPKSRARSRRKMPTNMPSKLLKFVYRYPKCCMDKLRFQNICRLNRRPHLLLLDFKEKCTRYAIVSTNEADLFDRHDRAGQSKMVYYHTYLQSLALFVEQTQKPRYK